MLFNRGDRKARREERREDKGFLCVFSAFSANSAVFFYRLQRQIERLLDEVVLRDPAENLNLIVDDAVFGTPVMRYLRARSGNSVASTANAMMFGLANAISLARATALGQCGQVGVENTWMVVGVVTASTRTRFSGVS
jgi:hypothetical protein